MYVTVHMPSDIVVAEGQVDSSLYFISRGVVRVWKDFEGAANARQLLVTLEENDFFGENSILGDGNAKATVECFSFCELLVLTKVLRASMSLAFVSFSVHTSPLTNEVPPRHAPHPLLGP